MKICIFRYGRDDNIDFKYMIDCVQWYQQLQTSLLLEWGRKRCKAIVNRTINSKNQGSLKKYVYRAQRNWIFATNSDFLITISLEPNVVYLKYFKLGILLDQIIWVWNIKGLQHRVLKILWFKYLILFPRLNSFIKFAGSLKCRPTVQLWITD